MLIRGRAQKVTVYLNEDSSSDQNFTYRQVLDELQQRGVAGATLIRPEEGFGSGHRLHDREGQGVKSLHLPVRIEFIDSPEVVESVLPRLCDLVQDGLIDLQETTIIKSAKRETQF
jgi:uncharacterized protein